MTPSPNAIKLIKYFEGLRLKAYLCSAGVPTIGYGQTGKDIKLGLVITEAEANTLLNRDLATRAAKLNELLAGAKTTQGQFDGMISLMFNIGNGAFASSSVLRNHKAGNFAQAAASFGMWVKATVRGAKVTLPGLVTRRAAEAKLYAS